MRGLLRRGPQRSGRVPGGKARDCDRLCAASHCAAGPVGRGRTEIQDSDGHRVGGEARDYHARQDVASAEKERERTNRGDREGVARVQGRGRRGARQRLLDGRGRAPVQFPEHPAQEL